MKKYQLCSKEELNLEIEKLEKEYDKYKSMNLKLNMARGKPCKEQLDLSMAMMDVLNSSADLNCEDGIDCRNYGVLGGIEECKRLLGDIIEVPSKNIIIYGNSSLDVMYECISRSYSHGVLGEKPWCKLDKPVKWLCPVPGYDRHFAITEYFGFEMINIPMNSDGPDMDMVEELIKDEMVKGIWCVPKYSNPDGTTYSEEVVKRFANLKPAAKDFRIYWDNAYSVHHLYDDNQDFLLEILDECKKAGNPDLVYKFTSTSKITFPGSGIAALATSDRNIEEIENQMGIETIGFDKVNQLRHVRFFKNLDGVKKQMKLHANILRPKFELVLDEFDKNLSDLDIAWWTKPHGGYFISLYCREPVASFVVKDCKDLGLTLTPAGSAYPYHLDPDNSNIRIAPSFPALDDLKVACEILTLSVKLESAKYLYNNK
ncbi:MAG: aminotransferase class I/II-fold pyridoxal phosphate-dependent enzyme [Bacilli bacterium]|nr:aminotransferase class I/II-fold pyridoxal phosphate-dependent enzyme [Bacilli bacterium]